MGDGRGRLVYDHQGVQIYHGDVLDVLRALPAGIVQTVVTSPPYWGLRDYGVAGQIGLEKTPEEFVAKMVEVFREVRRVLRDDGTLWLNLGDSYAANRAYQVPDSSVNGDRSAGISSAVPKGLKPKDLVGIPWRVAFALQADGWFLRSDIIWAKPNPMPESVTDRPTKAHEYIFLLTKSERYFYDADAVREPHQSPIHTSPRGADAEKAKPGHGSFDGVIQMHPGGRNKRSVWSIATEPFPEAHFATFPTEIPRLCISAGSKPGDTVLDPFHGSGTTAMIAKDLNRRYVGAELNEAYIKISTKRLTQDVLPLAM